MRVTEQMIFDQANRSTGLARSRVEHSIGETSSGLRVTHPGEDPAVAGLLVQSRALAKRFTAIADSAGTAASELNVADTMADATGNAVLRGRELAMQLLNPTYNASQRITGAAEVDQLFSAVLSHLNTQVGGRYVFGGNRDASAPFSQAGAYLGDTAVRNVEIGPGVFAPASVRADAAIMGVDPTTGVTTGANLLATLQALAAALRADDLTAIRATLDPLDDGLAQIATLRGQIGDAQNAMTTAVSTNEAALNDERLRNAKLGDADIIGSTTALAQAQQALQVSLAASAQGIKFTLLDFLR